MAISESETVRFSDLAHMMAKAMHPSDSELDHYGVTRFNLEDELPRVVRNGGLVVRNPAGLGKDTFTHGAALQRTVILPSDLRPFLAERSIELRLTPHGSGPDYWTLENAAAALQAQEGWHNGTRRSFQDQLQEAAQRDEVAIHDPHTCLPIKSPQARTYWELVTPADVNAWLERQAAPYRWNVEVTVADAMPLAEAEITYHYPMFERLKPRTPWTGGRMVDTDVLTLEDAASMATKHAGEPVTIGDFLRAAARGEITLRAIVHRTAKVRKYDGGIYCNRGQENENQVPAGAIATLPLTACKHLANVSRASWRTFDGFEMVDGVLQRYTKGQLVDGEPAFETLLDDCRVVGYDVRALADEYIAHEATQAEPKAGPVMAGGGNDGEMWKVKARERASEIIKRQKAKDLHPSQENIADEIANEFRTGGVMGAGGKPLTGAYIKRHALKGISSAQNKQISTSIRQGK